METCNVSLLNISSDDEVVITGYRKRGYSDNEVVLIDMVYPKPHKKSKALIPFDIDCVILGRNPDSSTTNMNLPAADDSQDLCIVGEKGEVACRDFPHSRHLCGLFPFASTSHESHCVRCHCYICDSPAPCSLWSCGTSNLDHCHATDKDYYWIYQRKINLEHKTSLIPTLTQTIHPSPQIRTDGLPLVSYCNPQVPPVVNGSRPSGRQLRIENFFMPKVRMVSEKCLSSLPRIIDPVSSSFPKHYSRRRVHPEPGSVPIP